MKYRISVIPRCLTEAKSTSYLNVKDDTLNEVYSKSRSYGTFKAKVIRIIPENSKLIKDKLTPLPKVKALLKSLEP